MHAGIVYDAKPIDCGSSLMIAKVAHTGLLALRHSQASTLLCNAWTLMQITGK